MPAETCLLRHRNGEAEELGCPFSLAYLLRAIETAQPRNFLSPSAIKSCPRQFVLKQKVDYPIEPETLESAIKGTAFHSEMQDAIKDEAGMVQEHRFGRTLFVDVDGSPFALELTGQPDNLDLNLGVIEDYKTTSGYLRKDFKGYDSHKLQLSIYGWIVRQKFPQLKRGVLYYTGNGQRQAVRFDLYSDEDVEAAIQHYAPPFIRFFLDNGYLPPIPQEPELLRFCATCPVREACFAYDQMGIERLEDGEL